MMYTPTVLTPVKQKLLELVRSTSPLRFTDIVSGLSRSKKRVADHINELEAAGYIAKQSDGRYFLTEKGRIALAEAEEMKSLHETYDVISGLTTLDRTALDEGLRLLLHEIIKIQAILESSTRLRGDYESWNLCHWKAIDAGRFISKARQSLGFDPPITHLSLSRPPDLREIRKNIDYKEIMVVREELETPDPLYPSVMAIDGDRLDAPFLMRQVERTMVVASQIQDIFKGSEPVRRFVELLLHAYLDPLRELTRKLATQNEKPPSRSQEPSPSPTDGGRTSVAPLHSS